MFKSPLVVGYKGEIGSFILAGLLKVMPKALNIWCFDINESEKEKIDRIKKSDTIFLCVPLQDTLKWIQKYNKYLKGKTIVEQTSLKGWIKKIKKPQFTLVSMHILFRPSATPDRNDRRTILIDLVYDDEVFDWRRRIEEITESSVCLIRNIDDHDRLMAYNQALVHRIILVLGRVLEDLPDTYISKKIKELEKRIKQGNTTLYGLIQTNKYLPQSLKDFNKELKHFMRA